MSELLHLHLRTLTLNLHQRGYKVVVILFYELTNTVAKDKRAASNQEVAVLEREKRERETASFI